MPSKIITEEIKNNIVVFYESKPMTIKTVCNKFNLSEPTVLKILKEKNISVYKKAKLYNPDLVEDFFHNINTEEKAYFLGLLIADGNVFIDENNPEANRQASISCTLDEEDVYLLEKFKECVKTNTKISSDGRGCFQIAVRSNIMAEDLKQYGIVQRKSFSTYFPKTISDLYIPHLIRGILDGDGSVQFRENKRGGGYLHNISFCGSHQLMEDLSNIIFDSLNLFTRPRVYDYKDRYLSEIKIQRADDIRGFGNWIDSGANIYMIRKKEKFDMFLNFYGNTEVSSGIAKGPGIP